MPADIIDEGFEGTGTPTGWYSGGSGDWDYTASPLSGSQSLRCAANEHRLYYNSGSGFNASELWFKILFKAEALPASPEFILHFYDPTQSNGVFLIELYPDGKLGVEQTATTTKTVDSISAGTTYNIWGHYLKGTGSNAILEVSFDVAGNPRPSSGNKHALDNHGFGSQNAGLLFLPTSSSTSVAYVYDDVQVASTDIFAGAATVTVNLTGVGASPAVGTLTFNGSFTLTGVAASPAIGTGTVTTAPPATVTVTLTGVGATPAIGIGHVAIEGEVIVPPDQGLVTGGPPHWYGILKDEKVYLVGVAANPQVGTITPMARGTLEELEKMYPFPKPVPRLVPRRKPKPTAFVYMLGVHPVPKIGSVTTKMFYEDDDEELSSILRMMDVDEEVISALKLAK